MADEIVLDGTPAYIGVLTERVRHLGQILDETRAAVRHLEVSTVTKDDFERLWQMVESIDSKLEVRNLPEVTLRTLQIKADEHADTSKDHETRIRTIETLSIRVIAWGSMIAFFVTLLTNVAIGLIVKKLP